MKKLILALSLLAVVALGCGAKQLFGTDTFGAIGVNGSGLASSFMIQRKLTTMSLPAFQTTVNDVRYTISNNTGGPATLNIAEVPLGTTCPATAPATFLVSLNVAAGTNIGFTSLGAATAAGFTDLLYHDYNLCAYVTQGTPTAAFTLQFQADSTQILGL